MVTPKPDTKVRVNVYIEREFRYVDINELARRFPKEWERAVDGDGIDHQRDLYYGTYERFIDDLVEIYGMNTVLGGEWNDEITEIEVEE